MSANAGIDLVYTWVDDSWPGYLDELRAYAASRHDLNPNRTRDNLELLRYSLRSVAAFAPWVRTIHVVTCRPQVPSWLDTAHPQVRVTHHDEFIDAADLPTFSSFAILCSLHRLPGVSARFIYMEDDMLLAGPVGPEHFADARGRIRVYPRLGRTAPPRQRTNTHISPWNAALALANHLLDERFGAARRRPVHHVPILVDRDLWAETLAQWPEATARTRACRFRRPGNIAPEYLYLHYALATGRGVACSLRETYRDAFYFPLENSLAWARVLAAALACSRPRFLTMNDNFGERPNPAVVSYVRNLLERRYPDPSPYERPGPAGAPHRTRQGNPPAAR